MRIRFMRSWLLLAASCVVAAGSLPEAVYAETRTAAALTPEAVWEAIDAAKDGDTVQLPEGTAVWSKGWNSGHGAKMKAITIQGAGSTRPSSATIRPRVTPPLSRCWEWKGSPSASRGSPLTEQDTTSREAGAG